MLNSNFNFTTRYNEQSLYENLIIESIQIYGMDIQYIPKTLVDFSKIFGEDPQKAFLKSYTIESYFENTSGFLGDKNFLNKLGLNIDKEMILNIAKRRFDEELFGVKYRYDWKLKDSYNLNEMVTYKGINYISLCDNNKGNLPGANSYYVNPICGDDNNSGLSPEHAWKTTTIADSLPLYAGQSIMYFDGTFWQVYATPNETANPITSPKTYYIDPIKGNDNNSGLGPNDAWKTTISTNTVPLFPGDTILYFDGIWQLYAEPNEPSCSSNLESNVITRPANRYDNFPNPSIAANLVTRSANLFGDPAPAVWQPLNQVRPREGDLIYLPVTHDLFEILFADHEEVFYQLGKIYVWKITCEKWRYSHEKVETGISDIDSITEQLENNNSVENDPFADNDVVENTVEHFLNLDPNSPF